MTFGRIKCFFESRGYGFIEDHNGREVYFHLSSIEGGPSAQIVDGACVYFDAITTGLGLEAYKVRLSSAA
jgi:cold shock CspA family protein